MRGTKHHVGNDLPKGESQRPCPQKNRVVVLLKSVSLSVGVGHLSPPPSFSPEGVSSNRTELVPHNTSSKRALNSAVQCVQEDI